MAIDSQEWAILLGLWQLANPARLRDGLWVEARVGRAMEAIGGRAIIKEWRVRSSHLNDKEP
jgi:hypothetical protein